MIITKKQEDDLIKRIVNTLLMHDDITEISAMLEKLDEYQTNIIADLNEEISIRVKQNDEASVKYDNFDSQLTAIVGAHEQASKTQSIIQGRLSEIEHALNIRNSAKNSKSPWAEIVATDYDQQTGQLKTTVDWNDAFIQSLISYGFRGKDDNEIISLWLTSLYHNFSGNKQP